jgi:hypothetical protein
MTRHWTVNRIDNLYNEGIAAGKRPRRHRR